MEGKGSDGKARQGQEMKGNGQCKEHRGKGRKMALQGQGREGQDRTGQEKERTGQEQKGQGNAKDKDKGKAMT